jgi:hypothetical protein
MWFHERIMETLEFYTKGSKIYRNRNLRTSREFGQVHQSCMRKIIGFYDPVEDEILSYEQVLENLNMNKKQFKSDGYADTIEDIFLFKPISKILYQNIQK